MTICNKCGVEYGENYPACPLCEIAEPIDKWRPVYSYNQPAQVVERYKSEIRKQMWEMTAIVALLVILFFIGIDLAYNGKIDWAIYPVASVVATWLILTSFIRLAGRPHLTATSIVAIVLTLTAVLDMADGQFSWFVNLAMPITITAGLLTLLVIGFVRSARNKGFNVLGIIVTAVSLLSVAIEIFTRLADGTRVYIKWSLIVSTALIPVAGVLFFLHYRMRRGQKLGSYFHV